MMPVNPSQAVKDARDEQLCPRCNGSGLVAQGSSLRRLREDAGLTLREVARRMGYSAAYVCDIEHGRRGVTGKLASQYKSALKARA